jgi:hypothetical protein
MSRNGDRGKAERGPAGEVHGEAPDSADAGRFVRGLTIGLIVGAVIAGSTLWRRFGSVRTRS